MLKLVFITSMIFAVSQAVLYGRDVTSKEDFSQGYRYNRPAPHYLPPHQETSTQASNHHYYTTTAPPLASQQQSWFNNNYSPSNNFARPTLAPPREKHFMGNFRPVVSELSQGKDDFNGYNYQSSSNQAFFVTTVKPNVGGYDYMRPEYQITEMLKPSSGYYYVQQTQNSKPTHLPVTDINRPSSSGYSYTQSQSSNPTEYFYNKPEKTSYDPAPSSNNNYYNNLYVPAQAPLNFGSQTSSSSSNFPMSSYQRPIYESQYNLPSSAPPMTEHGDPWYMNPKPESTNSFNNWVSAAIQFKPTSPTGNYLPPKNDFQPPYYKK